MSFKELQMFDKVTSWPQTFWLRLPVCNVASGWPRTFLHPRCFCLVEAVLGVTRYISNALRNNITLMSNEYYSEIQILNQ